MNDLELDIEAVIRFLESFKDDESLRRYLLRKFPHSEKLFWYDEETDCRVDFLFISSSNSRMFWSDNLKKYSHLYVFAVLTEWSLNDNFVIEERKTKFLSSYKDVIFSEICDYINQINFIPKCVHQEIGFVIDICCWDIRRIAPHFSAFSNYDKYVELLKTGINKMGIIDVSRNITQYLEFCKTTDIVYKRKRCIITVLMALIQSNRKLSILEQIKYLLEMYSNRMQSTIKLSNSDQLEETIVNSLFSAEESDYEILKKILIFCISNKDIYFVLENDDELKELQFLLWQIRIGDYLYNYKNFVKEICPDPFNFLHYSTGDAEEYYEDFFSPYDDDKAKDKYLHYLRPWNFLQCEEETHLSKFWNLYVSLYGHISRLQGEVYDDCNRIVLDVLSHARLVKSNQQLWTINTLKSELSVFFQNRDTKLFQGLPQLLETYKYESIIKVIKKAFEDCTFPTLQLDEIVPLMEVVYTDSKSSNEFLLSITIKSYLRNSNFVMKFPLPTTKIDKDVIAFPQEYLVPSDFVRQIIKSWFKFWGGIKDSLDQNEDLKIRQELQKFFKKRLRFIYNYIISYLDNEYIIYMKEKNQKEGKTPLDYDDRGLNDWLNDEAEAGRTGW